MVSRCRQAQSVGAADSRAGHRKHELWPLLATGKERNGVVRLDLTLDGQIVSARTQCQSICFSLWFARDFG